MTVQEMIDTFCSLPEVRVILEPMENDRSPDWNWFRVYLKNGWILSCGYGRSYWTDNHVELKENPKDSETVEIAIFDDHGDWYVVEGMTTANGGKTGVFGWKTAEELLQVIKYISMKEDRS